MALKESPTMKRSQSFLATALALSIIAFCGCTNDTIVDPNAPSGPNPTEGKAPGTTTAAAELQAEQAATEADMPEPEEANDIKAATDEDGYEWVDLGLDSGTLWAKCNIGADSPEEYGNYYAWGEIEPKTPMPPYTPGATMDANDYVNWVNYKYCQKKDSTMTKYCLGELFGTVDNINELEAADDAATTSWGEDWQIPTQEDFNELVKEANTKNGKISMAWAQVNRISGIKFTNTTSMESIFFPAGGYRYNYGQDCKNFAGMYWTRTLHAAGSEINDNWARVFYFTYTFAKTGNNERCYGLNIRPVKKMN